MSRRRRELDATALDQLPATEPWLLVFGGISNAGHRRAQRVLENMRPRVPFIVWFDGYTAAQPPSELAADGVYVIAYSNTEAASLWARLSRYNPSPRSRLGSLAARLIRRVGTLIRPYWGSRLLRPLILDLAERPAPQAIIYCDDSAIPLAWHAATIWETAPVVSDLSEL